MVLRVDEDKGFIDLSRKKVKPEDAAEHDQYYKKASLVHRILKKTAAWLDEDLESLYQRTVWKLYDEDNNVTAYDMFKKALK